MKQILIFISFISLCFSFEYNKKNLNVIAFQFNPILKSITNKKLYPNNNGHPYVSEYFSQDKEYPVNELIMDLNYASHGNVKVNIVKHYLLDEFPKYKVKIPLINGKSDYRYDEETYIYMSKSDTDPDTGIWYDMVFHPKFKEIEKIAGFQFDYDYYIKKYDLEKLRNETFFDMVWVYGIDPLFTFETMVVGKSAFWLNGSPLNYNCKNFIIFAFGFARRDSSLHGMGHSFEQLISYAFNTFNKQYNVMTQEQYELLNDWEKFIVNDTLAKGNAGVGNIHFPFNGVKDYDYTNEQMVYSNWEYWANYPNIKGTKKKYNSEVWTKLSDDDYIAKDPLQEKDADRLYVRFWMSMMPHINGFTKKGQLYNWWDYITNCDYVEKIQADSNVVSGKIGEEIALNYRILFASLDEEFNKYVKPGNNVQIDGNCVSFKNGKLTGTQKGTCHLTIYRDGASQNFTILIGENK